MNITASQLWHLVCQAQEWLRGPTLGHESVKTMGFYYLKKKIMLDTPHLSFQEGTQLLDSGCLGGVNFYALSSNYSSFLGREVRCNQPLRNLVA